MATRRVTPNIVVRTGDAARVGVVGVSELVASLEALGKEISTSGLRRSLMEGAKVLRDEARRHVVKDSGLLKRHINAESRRVFEAGARKPGSHVAAVAVRRPRKPGGENPRMYAHLVEYGTQPHYVGKGARVARTKRKQKAVEKGGLHPGTKPRPFMRPALDTKGSEAKDAIARKLRAEVDVAARRKRR